MGLCEIVTVTGSAIPPKEGWIDFWVLLESFLSEYIYEF